MTKHRNYDEDHEEVKKLISEARAEGLSPDEGKELDILISQVDATYEKLRSVQKLMEESFFETVGQAISMWAVIESILVAITGLLLRTSLEKVGVILYSIQNFHLWLNIIDELFSIDTRLGEFRSRWTDISANLRSLNDTRVRLAHHSFFHNQRDPNNPTLRPGRFDARKKSIKYQPLEMEHIVEFIEAVTNAMDSLLTLVRALRAQLYASRDKSAPIQADQPPEGAQ